MKPYLKVPIKKLFHGFASVRSYKVEKAKAQGQGLEIFLVPTEQTMFVEYKDLDNHYKNDLKLKSSRKVGLVYDLWDFDWKPAKKEPEPIQFNIFDSLDTITNFNSKQQ